jgi:hypothetical protein
MTVFLLIFSSRLGTELVTIYVGKARKEFVIHKKLICETAPFFDKAFNGGFKEKEGTMELPEDGPSAFDLFVELLYSGIVPDGNSTEYFIQPHKLYVFAEKHCLNELANKTMDKIQTVHHSYFDAHTSPPLAAYVFNNTAPDSPIRKFSIEALASYFWDGSSWIPDKACLELLLSHANEQSNLILDYFSYLRDRSEEDVAIVHPRHRIGAEKTCEFRRHAENETCHNVDYGERRWTQSEDYDEEERIDPDT